MKTELSLGTSRSVGTEVRIPCGSVKLAGEVTMPPGAPGLVLFAHGSGSSRNSPRNQFVAEILRRNGTATLLFDLLTPEEEASSGRRLVFNIPLLAQRLIDATRWLARRAETRHLGIGYFGASTGAAAALIAAAELGATVDAVVARGGRPDLAGEALPRVNAPTLFIVGGKDEPVLTWNRQAYERLTCAKELHVIAGATHLFEEPGALEEVARLASHWFRHHLRPR